MKKNMLNRKISYWSTIKHDSINCAIFQKRICDKRWGEIYFYVKVEYMGENEKYKLWQK